MDGASILEIEEYSTHIGVIMVGGFQITVLVIILPMDILIMFTSIITEEIILIIPTEPEATV
jgi:hypothetical protein